MMRSRPDRVYLICIGSELLKGETLNSNLTVLGRILFEHGFKFLGEITVPDNSHQIKEALRQAVQKSDWVITCGGLGPTFDDRTREVIAGHFHAPLQFSKRHYQRLIHRMGKTRSLSKTILSAYRRQCHFPENSIILSNRLGSASGFLIRSGLCRVIALPGVPREFETMLSEEVMPKHVLKHVKGGISPHLIAKAVGISEVDFLKKLGALPPEDSIQCGIYPDLGEVRFTAITSNRDAVSRKKLAVLKKQLERKLQGHIYSLDGANCFEESLGRLLRKNNKTVSVAESCTGGYAAQLMTRVPGSSKYFIGGITAYSNRVKERLLHVPKERIQSFGAVSRDVAGRLASQVRNIMNSDYGIGITGIAGPDGGSKNKPVGLVFVGIANARKVSVEKFIFKGDRERIRLLAGKWALYLLWRKIKFEHF